MDFFLIPFRLSGFSFRLSKRPFTSPSLAKKHSFDSKIQTRGFEIESRINLIDFVRSGSLLDSISGRQPGSRRRAGGESIVAGAILGTQDRSSLIKSFPKRLKATSHAKIHIHSKIFLHAGSAFGIHFGRSNRPQTLRQRWPNDHQSHSRGSRPVILYNMFS